MTDTLVQDVTNIMASYRDLVKRNPTYTDPDGNKLNFSFSDLTSIRKVIEAMKFADYYYLSDEFSHMIEEWYSQYNGLEPEDIRVSEFTRTPSDLTFIKSDVWLSREGKAYNPDMKPSNYGDGYLCQRTEDGTVIVMFVGTNAIPQAIGSYHPVDGLIMGERFQRLTDKNKMGWKQMLLIVAACCEIINHPRFVTASPAGTRQQRKHAKRAEGIAVEAWHKISWDINKPVQAKGNQGASGYNMPLHYTRGYFRKAKEHWNDVVQWKDGTWKKWVEGYWAGHPAFGIKKGYHAPTVGVSK